MAVLLTDKLNLHAAISTKRVVVFSPVQRIIKATQVSLCLPQDYHSSYHFQHGSRLPFSVIYFRILKNNQLNISALMNADIQTEPQEDLQLHQRTTTVQEEESAK